jgi:molybdenum cofactor cytidylyltransferase
METAVLILAAGSSSRMGKSKQLLPIDGKPMLARAVETAVNANPNVTVVLGSDASALRMVLSTYPITVCENPDWEKGMGRSLKSGLAFVLQSNPVIDAIIIMVCDQPQLTPPHLVKLIDKANAPGVTLVASRYNGTLGVPALFKRQHFSQLLEIGDEIGASRVIREQANPVWVDLPGGETDLDTFDEYLRFSTGSRRQ